MTILNYKCIYCSTPCDSLYRIYGGGNTDDLSSSSSLTRTIKLSQCIHCYRDVDPYCERELLLVVLDCLLFREEAYRHLFFHRCRERRSLDTSFQWDTWKFQFVLLLTSSFLRTYVIVMSHEAFSWSETTATTQQQQQDILFVSYYFFQQMILSAIIYLVQTGCMIGGLYLVANYTDDYALLLSTTTDNMWTRKELLTQIYLGILLPTIYHGATIFVQIWENSDSIRWMGSCFILAYQWFALHTIIRGTLGTASVSSAPSQTLLFTILFIMSVMMIRDITLEIARILWTYSMDDHDDYDFESKRLWSTKCPGVELQLTRLMMLPMTSILGKIPPICLS